MLDLLCASPAVINVVHLPAAVQEADGRRDPLRVAREDASVIISDLKELDIPKRRLDRGRAHRHRDLRRGDAAEKAAPGLPSDAVVWEEVEARTSEQTELSFSFVLFMIAAMQIAAVGIILDQPILIVGAMVVGPEFGPLAAVSVALVNRQAPLARRSLLALAVGFPAGIVAALLTTLVFIGVGVFPEDFSDAQHPFTELHLGPRLPELLRGLRRRLGRRAVADSAKSGALVGVLVSVTTIPAASNVGRGRGLRPVGRRQAARRCSWRSTWPASWRPGCSRCSSSAATTWCAGAST